MAGIAATATGAGASVASRTQAAGSIAWTPGRELDAIEWAAAGRRIGAVGRSIQWLLGDWITYGNTKFGERYSRASKITGYDSQTLMNMVYVASRFSISRRRENLSWSHHEALAALPSEEQEHWLNQAVTQRWSVSDLRIMLRTARKGECEDATIAGGEGEPEEAVHGVEVTCPNCGEKVKLTQA
jgi:hypothetical protein